MTQSMVMMIPTQCTAINCLKSIRTKNTKRCEAILKTLLYTKEEHEEKNYKPNSMCALWLTEDNFLGYVISRCGIIVNP